MKLTYLMSGIDENEDNVTIRTKQIDIVQLINKIKRLSTKEKNHILTILKKNNIPYTKNLNGYFFNLINLDETIYSKINQCIDLIEKNRELIESLEKKRELHIEYYKTLIENKVTERLNKKKQYFYDHIQITNVFPDFIIRKKGSNKITNTHVDIDEMMKMKKIKFSKTSIYYKINQILNKRKKRLSMYNTNNSEDNSLEILDNNHLFNDELSIIQDESYVLEDSYISDNDNIENDNNNHNDDKDDNENDDNENNDIDDNNNDDDNNLETSVNDDCDDLSSDNDESLESKLEFYKNLLKRDGYVFDDDKHVKMKHQAYIY